MKKWLPMLLLLFIVGCDVIEWSEDAGEELDDAEETVSEPEPEPEPEPVEEEEAAEEIEEESTIELSDQLVFGEYTVDMQEAELHDDSIDVRFSYLNQAGDGEKMFMQISLLDVTQGETILEEITDAWDIANRNSSDVYFPNAENGSINIELTYELDNTEEPITLRFTPMTEEDGQEVVIDIS